MWKAQGEFIAEAVQVVRIFFLEVLVITVSCRWESSSNNINSFILKMTRKTYSPSTVSHSANELQLSCIHNIYFIFECGENLLLVPDIDSFCLSCRFYQVLYPILRDVLDCNRFRESRAPQTNGDPSLVLESGELEVPAEIQCVVDILADTWRLLTDCQLHHEISSQLIGYLFFFINASLFNSLMEKGTSVPVPPPRDSQELMWLNYLLLSNCTEKIGGGFKCRWSHFKMAAFYIRHCWRDFNK